MPKLRKYFSPQRRKERREKIQMPYIKKQESEVVVISQLSLAIG
jgi:hypothetical protein